MSTIPKEVFQNVRRIQIRTTRTVIDSMAGAYHSAFKGQGIEFEEVREYIPGDDVRSIDWNVTARMNHTYIKNFREERQLTVLLAVDISGSTLFGSSSKSKRRYIAELAAVLALSAIHNNDKVGLVLFSDQVEKYIPPSKGLSHVLRVIRELLVFEPKSRNTNISEALRFLGKVHRRRGVCFLLSDFFDPDYRTELSITAKRHDLIGISVTDPLEHAFEERALVALKDLESGEEKLFDLADRNTRAFLRDQAREHQRVTQQAIERVGAGYMAFQTNEDYAEKLGYYLQHRPRLTRRRR